MLLPVIRRELPCVIDIHMPMEGIFHGCAIVALEKRDHAHPRRLMEALWGGRRLGDARLIAVVDADTDVHDISLVAWKVFNLVDWRHDIVVDGSDRKKIPLGRIGLDATRKTDGCPGKNVFSDEIARGQSVIQMVDSRWREYGL
jgi:4-hydroxy-3-polyprenylbenzoate decarboxylase